MGLSYSGSKSTSHARVRNPAQSDTLCRRYPCSKCPFLVATPEFRARIAGAGVSGWHSAKVICRKNFVLFEMWLYIWCLPCVHQITVHAVFQVADDICDQVSPLQYMDHGRGLWRLKCEKLECAYVSFSNFVLRTSFHFCALCGSTLKLLAEGKMNQVGLYSHPPCHQGYTTLADLYQACPQALLRQWKEVDWHWQGTCHPIDLPISHTHTHTHYKNSEMLHLPHSYMAKW